MIANFAAKIGVAFALAIGFLLQTAFALPGPLTIRSNRAPLPISNAGGTLGGSSIGGQSGVEFSLLNVKNVKLKFERKERLEIDYADRNGKPLHGEPGYFHLTMDRGGKRAVLDLAQVTRTAIDPTQLRRILLSSNLIAASEMTMDPVDGSTNITFQFKMPVRAAVAVLTEPEARLVLELTPLAEGRR